MDRIEAHLFGIAVILAGGFVMVGNAAGYPYDNVGVWGVAFGLGVSLVTLVAGLGTAPRD